MKKKSMLGCLTAVAAVMGTGAQAIEITIPTIQIPVIPTPIIPVINTPAQQAGATKTPIKHLVVIFGENRSYDHYFATYPTAQNNPGEVTFTAAANTPMVNNLVNPLNVNNGFSELVPNPNLLTDNPNGPTGSGAAANAPFASNPFRLPPSQAWTDGNSHDYTAEQLAYDNGNMDMFPAQTGGGGFIGNTCNPNTGANCVPIGQNLAMVYFDGNTVTGIWNLAQHFAMNDNMFTTMFGPSTPGAINMISGQTNFLTTANPSVVVAAAESGFPPDGRGNFTLTSDTDPFGDVCSFPDGSVALGGVNIGDLLNTKGITWGWFHGGFNLKVTNPNGTTGCNRSRADAADPNVIPSDYVPHHQPFQFFPSTANPNHLPPTSVAMIGHTDQANHQYDTRDFFNAVAANNLPAVSFLKAPSAQDAHPGNSNPLDEQVFIANVIDALEQTADWSSTAVIITYDDSDGWYDHQMPPIVNRSQVVEIFQDGQPTIDADFLNGPVVTTNGVTTGGCVSSNQQQNKPTGQLDGVQGAPVQGRCGYGTRIPFLVISPFAKQNFVDHSVLDQSSVSRFIEDNWLAGQRLGDGSFDQIAGSIENMFDFNQVIITPRKVFLNPESGEVVKTAPVGTDATTLSTVE